MDIWLNLSISEPPPENQTLPVDFTLWQDAKFRMTVIDKKDVKNHSIPTFSPNSVSFHLFTPKNPKKPQALTPNNQTALRNSFFDAKLPTRIFIHGLNEQTQVVMKTFAQAYFIKNKFKLNFIAVVWQNGRSDCIIAREHVEGIGTQVARLIDFLVEMGMNPKLLAMSGHSIGANVMGIG